MMKKILVTLLLIFTFVAVNAAPKDYMKDPTFKKAVSYFFQKKFSMAELLLQDVIKKNPEHDLAYSYLADIFLYKKQYDAALRLYTKAIDLNPSNADNYFRLGQVHYRKKNSTLALENFKKALIKDQKLKFAYYHLGLTYLMLERNKEETISNWEEYLRQAPEDPQYESLRRVIELLKDPNFKLPPVGSDITIEEALLLGGTTLKEQKHESTDRQAGHEKLKGSSKMQGLLKDDDL
jgi:tetratricopeptide (TPR) repeat protein